MKEEIKGSDGIPLIEDKEPYGRWRVLRMNGEVAYLKHTDNETIISRDDLIIGLKAFDEESDSFKILKADIVRQERNKILGELNNFLRFMGDKE